MKAPLFFVSTALFLIPLSLPEPALSQAKPDAASPGKQIGFTGDPARKRGLEIGYDQGRKAGRVDQGQELKPDPKRHEAYQKPESYFRSEYGSQASFVAGFRNGFVGGYQSIFGKKVPLSAEGTAKPPPPPPKSGGNASDAL